MGGKSSKKEVVREEVWGENRLGDEDGWGGITSYNLLDLQVTSHTHQPSTFGHVYLGPVSKHPTHFTSEALTLVYRLTRSKQVVFKSKLLYRMAMFHTLDVFIDDV